VVHHLTAKFFQQIHDIVVAHLRHGGPCCQKTLVPNPSQIYKWALYGSDAPDRTCVEHGCKISALSSTERIPPSPSRNESPQLKKNRTELRCLTPRLQEDLDQAEEQWEPYHNKRTGAQFNVSFHFENVLFYCHLRPDILY